MATTPVTLSILIPTVPGREAKLARLLGILDPQARRDGVEVLVLRDDRRMTIGEKRNKMISIARGEYVAFLDDDDLIVGDYVEAIMGALAKTCPDVICFHVTVKGHGAPKNCTFGLTLTHKDLPNEYKRKPNHIMVWRRALAASVPFPEIRNGEDTAWAEQVSRLATTEIKIPRVLYIYEYDPSDNSATPR